MTYDCEIASDGAWGRGEWIRSAEKSFEGINVLEIWVWGEVGMSNLGVGPGEEGKRGSNTPACLHGVTTFPDHGEDRSAEHI